MTLDRVELELLREVVGHFLLDVPEAHDAAALYNRVVDELAECE